MPNAPQSVGHRSGCAGRRGGLLAPAVAIELPQLVATRLEATQQCNGSVALAVERQGGDPIAWW